MGPPDGIPAGAPCPPAGVVVVPPSADRGTKRVDDRHRTEPQGESGDAANDGPNHRFASYLSDHTVVRPAGCLQCSELTGAARYWGAREQHIDQECHSEDRDREPRAEVGNQRGCARERAGNLRRQLRLRADRAVWDGAFQRGDFSGPTHAD